MDRGRRRVESSALAALTPAIALIPLSLLALAVFWLPLHALWPLSYVAFAGGYLAAGLLLFLKPVQVLSLIHI